METHKFVLSVAFSAAVFLAVLFTVFISARPAIESVPLDWGWAGFFFIFTNGFLLSCIIVNKKSGILDRLLLTVGLGFGLTFVVMILIGVLWQITLLNVLLVQIGFLAALGTAALWRGLRLPHFKLEPKNLQITKQHLLQAFLIMIICVLTFAAIYDALSLPPTEWDSLAYGVNYAKIIFQNNHIPLIAGPSIGIEMSAPYPPGMQLSASFFYVFAGSANDFYYRMLSPIFSLATLLVVYKFAKQISQNKTASVFAASALTLTPFFWELFIKDTYLMSLTFMFTMSAYFFYKAYVAKTVDAKNYEVLGSLFCGFAALTSYIGLLAFGVPLIYALHKRAGLKRIVGSVGISVLIALPWYLRNLVLLGNPVYPFAGGRYLDPLLHNSTAQSFEQYLQLPVYAWTSTLCKVAAVLLIVGIVFFTLSKKRKDFPLTMTLYILLSGISLMALYVAFPRYIIIALPMSAVFFGLNINAFLKKRRWPQIASAVFIAFVVLVSAVMFPYVNSVKPSATAGESRMQYIAGVFEEGNAWQWINQNTPLNAKIASFDIKEYYLNRTLFSLDGNESVPLYYLDSIQEATQFLKDKGVGYVLSVPWASPTDIRLPSAYTLCIITRYLGDINYFPPLFIDNNGTAVYHVGALTESEVNQEFPPEGTIRVVAPLWNQTITINTPNTTNIAACYIPFPVDWRTKYTTDFGAKNITVSLNSPTTHLELEFYNDKIPEYQLRNPDLKNNYMIANSLVTDNFNITQSSFTWHIDQAGYFTIRILNRQGNFTQQNVPLDITFVDSQSPEK
jgi:4-amino-4-deoxy-L-arabinose transferase-like glycosyltransferase